MKFVFLLYVSRSGSTMFARQLSMCSTDIIVLPEFRLLELLIGQGDGRVRNMDSEELLSLMKLDHQIDNLRLDEDSLSRIAQSCQGSGIRNVMESISRYCAETRGIAPEVVVVKNGTMIEYYRELIRLFPGSDFIYIYRDPRGVANSMLRTRSPYFSNEKLGRGDVVFIANAWAKYMMISEYMKKDRGVRIIDVRYEELCSAAEDVISDVFEFIGVPFAPQLRKDENTFFEVGESEKGMHSMFDKPPDKKRLEGWKTELSMWQGVSVEAMLARKLQTYGYEQWFMNRTDSRSKVFYVLYAYLNHCYRTVRDYYLRLLLYMRNRKLFWNRFRLFIRRNRIMAFWKDQARQK